MKRKYERELKKGNLRILGRQLQTKKNKKNIGGEPRQVLHELKRISSSQSRYKPSWEVRGVDKRAEQLHQEYVTKARKADQDHGGVVPGTIGGVERKLMTFPEVEGLVFGTGVRQVKPLTSLLKHLLPAGLRLVIPS